jgi:hypothetical protein
MPTDNLPQAPEATSPQASVGGSASAAFVSWARGLQIEGRKTMTRPLGKGIQRDFERRLDAVRLPCGPSIAPRVMLRGTASQSA